MFQPHPLPQAHISDALIRNQVKGSATLVLAYVGWSVLIIHDCCKLYTELRIVCCSPLYPLSFYTGSVTGDYHLAHVIELVDSKPPYCPLASNRHSMIVPTVTILYLLYLRHTKSDFRRAPMHILGNLISCRSKKKGRRGKKMPKAHR